MKPPVARSTPCDRSVHSDVYIDNFAWLENKENPDTIAYLQAENDYTDSVMEPLRPLQETLLSEFQDRVPDHDSTAPYTLGKWTRFATIEHDQNYWVYKRELNGAVEILLDENERAKCQAYYTLDALQLNPAQNQMAWLEDTTGNEHFQLYIQDLKNKEGKETIEIVHPNIKWGLAWLDDHHLVYTVGDDADRPCEIRVYDCITKRSTLVWHEKDEHFHLSVQRARVGNVVLCEAHSKTTSEIHLLRWVDNRPSLQLVRTRQHGVKYTVEVGTTKLYVRSNQERREFALYSADLLTPAVWNVFWVPKDGISIEDIDLFDQYILCWIRTNGLQQIRSFSLHDTNHRFLTFPDPAYEIYSDINPTFHSDRYRLRYTSMTQPDIVLEYALETGEHQCIHRFNTPNHTPEHYVCERVWAQAKDGTQIPISVAGSIEHQHTHGPLLMVGYGAYGVSYNAGFYSPWVSLMDRGFRIAIAHIRGGGELGRTWYNAGKGPHKQNSFHDFIACAERLIELQYTTQAKLVISGGSAGGLLVAACLNQRPELFGGCVAEVPFVDVTTTMLNPNLPLTVIEYEEWGNPNNPIEYDYIQQYDPYRQYLGQAYPPTLITAGLHDPRVGFWEPAKWTAKIRSLHPNAEKILLKTNMRAGHNGSSGRTELLKEDAVVHSFILWCTSDKENEPHSKI